MATVDSFEAIREDFMAAVEKIVWCNVATVDTRGRPRSRVLHPMWEGSTGWILTGRQSLKAKHLADNPNVSLVYIADPLKPIYVEGIAEWVDDDAEKRHRWDWFKNAPEPYGYDPAPFFGSVDSPNFGILKITPWLIDLHDLMGGQVESGKRNNQW